MATTTEVSKEDRATAQALEEGWPPYTDGQALLLDRVRPGWRTRLRELKESGAAPRGPSADPEKETIDRAIAGEFGAALAKAEQEVGAAHERLARASGLVHDHALRGAPPAFKGEVRLFSSTDVPASLRDEQHTARQLCDVAQASLANIQEKIRARRHQLAVAEK